VKRILKDKVSDEGAIMLEISWK